MMPACTEETFLLTLALRHEFTLIVTTTNSQALCTRYNFLSFNIPVTRGFNSVVHLTDLFDSVFVGSSITDSRVELDIRTPR